ncbi:unnamed protein product [Prunus armeniaca]
MSNSNTNSSEDSSHAQSIDESAPLWKYVTKVESSKKVGGNISFTCHYCQSMFQGSYSRVKHHLLKIKGGGIRPCNKVTQSNLSEMKRLVDDAELKIKNAQARRTVSLPTSSKSGSLRASASAFDLDFDMNEQVLEPKKRKGVSGPLEKAFQNNAREQLDSLIARMFYTSGLSFNLARNRYYVQAFSRACYLTVPGYRPPGYNALRTTLLQKERSHIEMKLEPIKNAWKLKGVSLCSDGWSDSQRRPLINMMATRDSGPMFLKAINCEGETKNASFIANLLDECIREIGPQNVVQVITDNASACKAARQIIEAKYSHIFWTPCVVHTLNLALKNICTPKASPNNDVWGQCIWISDVADECWAVKNYIMNHQMRLAIFNHHSKLKFLSIADTRFASIIVISYEDSLQH